MECEISCESLLYLYLRQAGETMVMQNWCAEIKIRAERRAGELLQEMDRHRPEDGRPTGKVSDAAIHTPTLEDLGLSRDQSSHYQTMAMSGLCLVVTTRATLPWAWTR